MSQKRTSRPLIVALLVLVALSPIVSPTSATSSDVDLLAGWIGSLQYTDPTLPQSFGALRLHHTPGAPGFWQVVPYDANVALTGLLGVPGNLDVAERWILWVLNHTHRNPAGAPNPLLPDGIVFDHWYDATGTIETLCAPAPGPAACLHRDADDSNSATFAVLLRVYAEAGGTRAQAFLTAPGVRDTVETIAGVMLALRDADNLTWARPEWPQKYLMDNAEVHLGLVAMAALERDTYGDTAKAQAFEEAAEGVRAAIFDELYDNATGLFHVAKDRLGSVTRANLGEWYPGTVALAWPHLHGVTPADGTVAQAQMAALNDHWDGSPGANWTQATVDPTGFLWPSIAHAALLTGDEARANAHVAYVNQQRFPTFPYPWTAADAGWMLRTLTFA